MQALAVQQAVVVGQVQVVKDEVAQVRQEVAELKAAQQEAAQELGQVERATQKPPEKTDRVRVNELVRAYADADRGDHRRRHRPIESWPIATTAGQSEEPRRKVSPLDVIEQEGLMRALWLIASDVLVQSTAA